MILVPLRGVWNTTLRDLLGNENILLHVSLSRSGVGPDSCDVWNNHLNMLRDILGDSVSSYSSEQCIDLIKGF